MYIIGHSLLTIPSSDIHEEYILLIGGVRFIMNSIVREFTAKNDFLYHSISSMVSKFNGTWYNFGKLRKPRYNHNCIYWNGAVYVIGGKYNYSDLDDDLQTKIEIWKIDDSPDQFISYENWPLLFDWRSPHLFIVPDTFFPDY